MRLRNQWLLLCVTLVLKVCTFLALCLALYVQPKSVHHEHVHTHNEQHADLKTAKKKHTKEFGNT